HDNVIILRKMVGTTKIIVPVDVEVSLSVNCLYGDLTFFNQPKRALRNEHYHQETKDYLKSNKSVKIFLTTMIGDVEVVRG
ncbi:TPA: transporter, partial [Streptococcus pneumoniae]|nr:transporter [Streptococcus pneumoniae]